MKKLYLGLVFILAIQFSWAQELLLRGKIIDNKTNQPISGATIKLSGSDVSTMSGADGSYKLPLADGYETVIINAEGFSTQKIFLGGKTELSVNLKAGKSKSDESTSVGFGSQSKSEMTGSVSSISTDDVSPSPLINLEQANQGKTTGMFVQNSSGKLGEGTTVRIRGGSSLSASNQPLYVIDGVPLTSGNQSNINPSNIAKLEILKDASAGAMFGARAANGVILITTKSGGSGKMKVDADYQFGVSQTPRMLDMYSPEQYNQQVIEYTLRSLSLDQQITKDRLIAWEAQEGANRDIIELPNGSTVNMPNFYDSLTYNTDWQDEVFRTATSHRANVSLQGGTEALGYFGSVSYTGQEGILIGNKFDRINASMSLDSKVSEKLSANLNVNYFYSKDYRLKEDQDLGAPLQAIVLPPSDGYSKADNYGLIVRKLEYNPLTEVNFSDNLAFNNSVVANLGLKYDLSDVLTIDMNGGVDYNASRQEIRNGPETRDGALTGRSQFGEQNLQNYIFNGWATYQPNLSEDNSFSAMLGVSFQESEATADYRVANINSVSDLKDLPESNTSLTVVDIPGSASRFVSSFGRFNYSIMDKYVFQVSGRLDGSSKFGADNRYGFFPAVSTGWNVSNESFMDGISQISFLKLKASYGLVGNTPSDDFLYRSNYFNVRYGDAADGLRLANLANPALRWETTAQLNVGLEFGIFGDRISGSVDYYNKTTTDLLFPVPVSQTSGFSSVLKNVGAMENKGIELNLSTINFESGDFSWSTDFNMSFNTNTVTDLGGADLVVGVNAFREGEAAGVFYMRKYVGVDAITGEGLYDNMLGGTTTDWESAPRQVVGDPNPDFFGGLINSLRYKNFELSAMIQFVQGNELYFETGEFLANSGILNLGQLESQDDRWYAVGDDAKYPVLDPFQENTFPSTRWLQDGSYIRLKTITLSYNIPVDNMGLQYASIYIGATNLFTLTNYTGYDPDVSYFDPLDGVIGQNISRGIDNFTAPQPKIFMTGIKIGL